MKISNKIMKQTVVEFIFEELENRQNGYPYFTMEQIYNKAKEMEKEQQGYSHEEVKSILFEWSMYKVSTIIELVDVMDYEKWFEQFKKI